MRDRAISITIKEQFFVSFVAGAAAANYNIRPSSIDAAAGGFSAYAASNSSTIRTLG